ncbi:MAG: hypothetical protein LBF80_05930 [Spirochaetaceae bacterium]|jgi:hypothetical protein|nr:hypothetical protein [Spirochaetaceae bacterium]
MVITIPEKIETRKTPLKGKELKDAEESIRRFFDGDRLSLGSANEMYSDFFDRSMSGKNKDGKMDNAVNDFLFISDGSFNKWFSAIPPDGQKILYAVVFDEYVDGGALEKILNVKIKFKENWNRSSLDPVYKLNFLTMVSGDGSFSIGIPQLYRAALLPQFMPPPETLLKNCLCEESKGASVYNNGAEIIESLPLFCDALNEVLSENQAEKTLYRPFAKKTLNRLYKASGFPPFPFETEKAVSPYSPAAADMLGRFMLFMTGFSHFARPENPAEFLRSFVKVFFGLTAAGKIKGATWLADTFEYNMFFSHLSKSSMYENKSYDDIFYLRRVFRDSVLAIAEDGCEFDACALVKREKYGGARLSFFTSNEISYLKIRAYTIHVFGRKWEREYWESFHPAGTLRFDFLEKPLLLGYFYLFAALGILEITQAEPPLICGNKGKMSPASIFDSLKTVKITEFGLWCMGLSKKLPEEKKGGYEAIADNELYLVTVRGKSLERTIFLDRIGEKLGEDRWRINPSTFISGCESKTQIEERVGKFYKLIDPDPAPHWKTLFKTVVERADFLGKQEIDAIVYQLPFDTPESREVSSEILADPELSGVAMRAEGGILVVPFWGEKRFYALLAAHGISRLENQQ